MLKPRFLNSRFFVSPFTLAQKTANLAQVRNFAIFWIGTAHARTFHIFPSIESAYNCVCVCVCVCVTQMSSFSNFDIIVLDWGAYKCVCVCVCLTRASSLIESNIIVLDWGRCLQLRVCLTFMSSFSKCNITVLDWGACSCVCV